MKRILYIVCLIVALNVAGFSQIRLRIPRPRTNQPPPPGQVDQPVAPAPAPASGGDRVDDGFTWFEAVSTEALGQNNIPYSTGWVLKSHVRVFGEYPNRSAIKLVVTKAGRAVATTRC